VKSGKTFIARKFHSKKESKKKKKKRKKKKRDVVIRVFPYSIVKKVTADCLLLVLNTKGQIGN
jgi:hypothetical protein